MEAVWNIEDKWKLTTNDALLLLCCTSLLLIGLCTAMVLKMVQRKQSTGQEEAVNRSIDGNRADPGCSWMPVKRMLMGTLRWSRANKWGEKSSSGSWKERMSPLLGYRENRVAGLWWPPRMHESGSPVWQRPILMGEKCQLPRFSGLILYDEAGKLLKQTLKDAADKNDIHHQVEF